MFADFTSKLFPSVTIKEKLVTYIHMLVTWIYIQLEITSPSYKSRRCSKIGLMNYTRSRSIICHSPQWTMFYKKVITLWQLIKRPWSMICPQISNKHLQWNITQSRSNSARKLNCETEFKFSQRLFTYKFQMQIAAITSSWTSPLKS